MTDLDEQWMQEALALADKAAEEGEVPVGAVVVFDGEIIGRGYNQPISSHDPTAHAEIVALREAARLLGNYRLVDTDLFVTLEPCSMCAGAIAHSRVKRLIYGAKEPKAGVVESRQHFFQQAFLNHCPEVLGGVLADCSAEKLQHFFQKKRDQQRNIKRSKD